MKKSQTEPTGCGISPRGPPFPSRHSFAHLVRARGNRPRRKQPPRHPVPVPTNATSVLTGAAPGATSGRFVLRASQPVCRPLPARRLSNYTDRFLRKHLENKLRQTQSPALSSHAGGGPFFFSPSLFSFSAFLYFFLVLLCFSFPLFLFSLTKAHKGAHPALPGKTGRAGCEAAVRQLPLATGRATMPAYSRGNSTIEKNNATCQRATNREHTTKTKNRAPATFGAT